MAVLFYATVCAVCISAGGIQVAAQHIHGIVRDSLSRAPLTGVSIRIQGQERGAVTDKRGIFHVHDVSGSLKLVVSHVGYQRQIITVSADSSSRIEILLPPAFSLTAPIVVEADKIGAGNITQNVRTLTTAELDHHRGQSFADALTIIPGVSTITTGPTLSKPVIRGLHSQRLVLLNAGIVQEGQQWGMEHAPEIDPFTAARVSIVKGPSAVQYGPGAMGGVISVEPLPLPVDGALRGNAWIYGFSNSLQGAASLLIEDANLADEDIRWRVQGSVRRAGDSHTPLYNLRNTAFMEYDGAVTLETTIGSWMINTHGSWFNALLGIYQGAHIGNATDLRRILDAGHPLTTRPFSYDINPPRQEISHRLLSVTARHAPSPNTLISIRYGFQQNYRQEFDAINVRVRGIGDTDEDRRRDSLSRLERALATPAMELLLTTYTANTNLQWKLANDVTLQLGADLQRQNNSRGGSVFIVPDFHALGGGLWSLTTWQAGSISVTAGLRADYRNIRIFPQERFAREKSDTTHVFSAITAGMGIALPLATPLLLQVNVGTTWRPPQVNELYSNDLHHGSAIFEIGNKRLSGERAISGDATLSANYGWLVTQVAAFGHYFNNGFVYGRPDVENPTLTVRGVFPTYRFEQDRALMFGGDFLATAHFTHSTSVYTSASVVRGSLTGRHTPMFMMPADRGRVGLHVHADDLFSLHDPFFEVEMEAVRRQTDFERNLDYADPPDGYVLVNLRAGFETHAFESTLTFNISVRNLFDQQYRDYQNRFRYFALDPGRNVTIRLNFNF